MTFEFCDLSFCSDREGVVKTVLDRIPEPKNVTMLMMTGILGGGVDPKYSEYVVCLYHSNVYSDERCWRLHHNQKLLRVWFHHPTSKGRTNLNTQFSPAVL